MGTTLLALAFSAFVVWVISKTTMTDEEAKGYGYKMKGKLLGMRFYTTEIVDGEFEVMGGNLITDSILPIFIEFGIMITGEFKCKMEVLDEVKK